MIEIRDDIPFNRVERRGRKDGSKNATTSNRDKAVEAGVALTEAGMTNAEAAIEVKDQFRLHQTKEYIERLIGERRSI